MTRARLIQADELDDLLELYVMLQPEDPELDRGPALRAQWRDMLDDDSLEIVVLEHDDRLVASCVLSVTPNLTRNARPWAVIENVITHEDYRNEGFGERCVRAPVERAEAHDCYKVMLLSGADQEWKLQFYERCGFDREEKTGFVLNLQ